MDKGKIGESLHYPNTFLLLPSMLRHFHLLCRQTECIAQGHARGVPSILDFITICKKRINKLNISINTDKYEVFKDNYFIIAINRTDIKVTNRGQWMRQVAYKK